MRRKEARGHISSKQAPAAQDKDKSNRRQRRPDAKAADCPRAGNKDAERGPICGKAHAQPPELQQGKHAGAPGAKARITAASRARTASPPYGAAAGQKEPLRTGKIRVRSFACPEGPCEPGPPKNRFAVFGWHGLFLLRTAPRAAQNKRGRRPRSLACRLGCGLPVANRKHRPNREMRPALIRVPPARRFSPAGSVGANSCATGTPLLACRLGRR